MPRYGSESDSSHKGRSRRKKSKKKRSSSLSSKSRSSSRERPRRYRNKSRSKSRSRDRKSKSKSRDRDYSSRSSSHKRSHRKHQKRRSTSRHRSRHDRRSRSRSRGRRSRRSRSNTRSDSQSRSSRISSKYSRSNSASPKRSKSHKGGSEKSRNMTEDEILKAKLQAAFKAAATADAMLREKGFLPESATDGSLSTEALTELTIDQQMKRAQAIEDINSTSFIQQDFKSTRSGNKNKLEPQSNLLFNEVENSRISSFSDGKPLKIDDSWKNNAEKLVHPNLFKDMEAKMEKWKEKLTAMRIKKSEMNTFV